jgi:hippurate hydrolase
VFEIVVHGKSGHAAFAHTMAAPIPAALPVAQSQTMGMRQGQPAMPAVVTVGRTQGGLTHNRVPDS